MTFVDRLLAKAARTNQLNKTLYSSWFSRGLPVTPSRNYTTDLIEGYMDNEVIYSIINRIARPASEVPLEVVDGKGKVIENHWVNKILLQPNPDTTITELIFNYYVYLLSIGNSFIYAPKLSDGRTIELWTMPSAITDVVAGTWKNPVAGYIVRYGSVEDPIEKKNVLHSKLFNPRFDDGGNWLYGLSPIAVASEIIRNINAGNERMALLAETGAPPFIISSTIPEGLTKVQQELLEHTYDKKYTGEDRTNKPMLSGTPLKVDVVGSNAADLELVKSSEHATRVLCNIYGVSSILLNDNENSTYNNVIELKKDLYTNTIIPFNTQLEGKLKQWLVPTEDVFFKFNYTKVESLSQSIDERMKTVDEISFITEDEKRAIFAYPPLTKKQVKPVKE